MSVNPQIPIPTRPQRVARRAAEAEAARAAAHPREVVEAALAHRLKDKAEAAYAHGDLFTKRRKLVEEWAAFLARPAAPIAEIERLSPASHRA